MEDDGIGEKPWQLPEAPPLLKEESITYEIVNNWQNPVRISLGIPSKVETNERSEATAATDPGLGLDPRVSPGFFSATNNGHLSAIYPSIHPSIHHFRPFSYPSTLSIRAEPAIVPNLFLYQALILPVF
jgi:hypothetical protein